MLSRQRGRLVADALVGNIVANLRVDATAWQRGLQQAQQQLAQFSQGLTQQTQQGAQQAQQLSRVQMQAALQASREQMQAARLAAQEQMQLFRQASAERIQASRVAAQAEVLDFRRSVEAARQAAREQREAMRAAAAEARGSGGGLAGMLQVAGGIGIATSLGAMTSAVVSFGREVVQTGARLEQLRASLSAIAGSGAAGQQQFQFLTATAQQLGVALEPIARGWRNLTAAATQANLPLTDQQRLFTALVTEGRRVGASNEELNRALTAVAQTASKGKVSMEELRQQLGEALPTAFAAVARGMGRTTEELEKLIETGSVRFPAFARALTRGFEQMQAASGQMTETSQAAFNRLGNALTAFRDALAQNILPELARLARMAQGILETATRIITVTGGRGGGGAQGPTIQELGGTEAQQREVERLNRVITTLEARQGAGTPLMQETIRNQIQAATELREQVLATIRATQDQAIEQGKVTAEVNRTNTAQQLQADYVADVTRKFGELRKAQEDFRKEAALAPERLGRPGSAEFLKGMEQATRQQLEDLTKLVARPPEGVTIPQDVRQQLAAADIAFANLGRQQDALRDKERERRQAEREAAQEEERARRERLQQTMATGQEYLRAVDQEIRQQEQAFEQLERLFEGYTQTKQVRDADTASTLEATLATSQYAAQAKAMADAIRDVAAIEAQLPRLRQEAAASAPAGELAIKQVRDEAEALKILEENLERVRAAREQAGGMGFGRSREELRLEQRTREDIRTEAGQQRANQLRQQTIQTRLETERLVQVLDIWRDLSQSLGSSWTQALESIAAGTQTVSEAFREMARSILRSMGEIAANQATQALFKLGTGLLLSALTGPTVNPTQYSSPIGPGLEGMPGGAFVPTGGGIGDVGLFQHGGIVRAPTMALLAENPSTAPEAILNRQQLQSLFGGGGALGSGGQGQGANGISIHNYPDRAAAEEGAQRSRGQGEQAIVNAVNANLAMGESSSILRSLRTLQR